MNYFIIKQITAGRVVLKKFQCLLSEFDIGGEFVIKRMEVNLGGGRSPGLDIGSGPTPQYREGYLSK